MNRRQSNRRNYKENYEEEENCEILDNIYIPILERKCNGQTQLTGNKCYKNKCYKVTKILSGPNNFSGNVVEIQMNDKSYIVKWNKYKENKYEMIKEIKFQNIIYTLGLAPKIETYYEDKDHIYIFMENLLNKGYQSLGDLYKRKVQVNLFYKKIPENILKIIGNHVKILHEHSISHGDLHFLNIFYNPETKSVKFIDFGYSNFHLNKNLAKINEHLKLKDWIPKLATEQWGDVINYF